MRNAATNPDFTVQDLTQPEHRQQAKQLLERVETHDGIAAFSEQFLNGLSDQRLGHQHTIALKQGQLVGIAALADDNSAELAVDPEHRRGGIGSALISTILERQPDAGLWAHGNLSAAQHIAQREGFHITRELLVMGLLAGDIQAPELPDGYAALNYSQAVQRFGKEQVEQAWLNANNEAFSWHPEQGGWDLERLHRAMEADWFDPEGVWFLYDVTTHADQLAGFHWTKRHPNGTGEVYVVGLASDHRGRGLGKPLLELGLFWLKQQGSEQIILYVEADNAPAVKRYEQDGFAVRERHVVYKK